MDPLFLLFANKMSKERVGRHYDRLDPTVFLVHWRNKGT